ncbi:30S ribosomal protein S8 [Desulfonatronum sp. SC1]|uniref:30S ribosomal protein S8 n=1 Tax=Desulfonatronum sp. SC1 TaxID=2109626 RepID=UPI000D305569|nr:30S ribosomal protein S8 [Desulfonatronum sp. SC1]PTN37395.1 30S ribosomal protein S8 [Desulfonatronum sp. SC1]
MLNDPIADMLTRIRNAQKALHKDVQFPASRMTESIAAILKDYGFVSDVAREDSNIRVVLKYLSSKGAISGSRRLSKPGLRIYVGAKEIPAVQNGLGIAILSTPKGVLEGRSARSENVGGELLCEVW